LTKAVRLAQGVVQKNPNIPGFVDTLGWIYYKKGLYGAAVEQLRKAVELDDRATKASNGSPAQIITTPWNGPEGKRRQRGARRDSNCVR